MTSRQERSARATKAAAVKAEEIVSKATAAATRKKCRACGATGTAAELKADGHPTGCQKPAQMPATLTRPVKAAATTPPPAQAGSVDLSAECKRLRGTGMAWWLIGKTLGLPGAGDSAVTGKAGAHQARRLYAKGNGGEVPRSRAPRVNGVKAEKGPAEKGTKTERKVALTLGEQIIPEDLDAVSIVSMLAGKTIEWGVNLADLCPGPDEWYNHEARVHPWDVKVDEALSRDGCRTVRFREFYGYEKDDKRGGEYPIAGPTRTVRLRSIHTVR